MGKSEHISTPVEEANLDACHPSHQVLFEPVQIGPVTAPNRFYQVPHASGMTETHPRVRAAFRETKAEGGWGVVNTGGNFAGIVVAPLMPYLASHVGWLTALSTGTVMAFVGAALWLFIRADRPFVPKTAAA